MSEQKNQYRDRSQERAKSAWGWVDEAVNNDKKIQGDYGRLARKLPSYLQVSGLGQTMAFLFSGREEKKTTAHELLFKQLAAHLRGVLQGSRDDGKLPAIRGMEFLVAMDPVQYRVATREAQAVAEWLKRCAEGRIPSAEDE